MRLGAATVITPVEAALLPEGTAIIDSRFVNTDKARLNLLTQEKRATSNALAKSRLVVRGDQEKRRENREARFAYSERLGEREARDVPRLGVRLERSPS